MKTIALFVVFLFALGVLVAAGANNCNGLPNNLPIVTDAPVLLRTVAQGKLYQAGQGDNQFFVAHVYGTPYQMGYAHGSLLQKEINLIVDEFYKYMGTQIDQYIKFLPKEVYLWACFFVFSLKNWLLLLFGFVNCFHSSVNWLRNTAWKPLWRPPTCLLAAKHLLMCLTS